MHSATTVDGVNPSAYGGSIEVRKPFLARFLAVGDVEWQMVKSDPRTHRELMFHALALIVCPVWFGITVANVANNLFEYAALVAVGLAVVAAGGLFLVDWHYLVQRRGTPENLRGGVNKVRFASLVVLMISSILMATLSFREDIEHVLSQERGVRRTALEQSPRYKLELDAARDGVARLERAAKRVGKLQIVIGDLEVAQAEAWEGYTNECQGNTSGNHVRVAKCGAIARGFKATAERLGQEIQSRKGQLVEAQDLAGNLPAMRLRLSELNAQIDGDASRSAGGPLKRLKVLWAMMLADLASAVTVLFWMALGTILDLPIWLAQGRTFNHEVFAGARKREQEALAALLGRLGSELRRQHAASLAPIEVRLTAGTPAQTRPARANGSAGDRVTENLVAANDR